jgi:hypothetical protein
MTSIPFGQRRREEINPRVAKGEVEEGRRRRRERPPKKQKPAQLNWGPK